MGKKFKIVIVGCVGRGCTGGGWPMMMCGGGGGAMASEYAPSSACQSTSYSRARTPGSCERAGGRGSAKENIAGGEKMAGVRRQKRWKYAGVFLFLGCGLVGRHTVKPP